MNILRSSGDVELVPGGAARGDARLPGSKSLINRHLFCAALADGDSTLRGVTQSDDVVRMIGGLRALQIDVRESSSETLVVGGCRGRIPAEEARIDVGHAGTVMRFLAAFATLGHGTFVLDGSARMRQRPIGALVDGLRQLGGRIEYEDSEGFPPIAIHAHGLTGGECVFSRPPSSQFVSALLMAAPYARQDVMLRIDGTLVSRPYVEMTMDVMRSLGVETLDDGGGRFIVAATQRYAGGAFDIEPDASAASYFWAAAALTGGSVRVPGLTRRSRQGDIGFVDVLAAMGCAVAEDAGGLRVTAPQDGELRAVDVDLNSMPDTVQTLAVMALFAKGTTRIRNVANLRIKETDRLAALGSELTKLGARVAMSDDSIEIDPPANVILATIDTYDDHRMAMSFALVGLRVAGVRIQAAACVSKSFPDYFERLAEIT